MTEIALVSCTKSKRDSAARPSQLYSESAFFRKAREYVRQHHESWYILSAKHHLLEPNGPPIAPYDETLKEISTEEKREWAQTVHAQLEDARLIAEGNTFVFHAGRDYYDQLIPLLEEDPVEVETPTDGLQLGPTLAWYNERL